MRRARRARKILHCSMMFRPQSGSVARRQARHRSSCGLVSLYCQVRRQAGCPDLRGPPLGARSAGSEWKRTLERPDCQRAERGYGARCAAFAVVRGPYRRVAGAVQLEPPPAGSGDSPIRMAPGARRRDQRPGLGMDGARGNDGKAYVLNLLIAQMLSLQRVQHSIQTLIGLAISEATILKYVLQLHLALERWVRSAIDRLLIQPAMKVDETSLRVEKRIQWIHVCSAGEMTLKFVHEKRGLEAMTAIGVIPRYGGVIIHDCWASYLSYEHCEHGLCGEHLLRELSFFLEANGIAWAKNMKRLLQHTCARVAKRKRKRLSPREYDALQKRYRNILTRGHHQLPSIPPNQIGKRGRVAKSDAQNLWARLHEFQSAALFAKNPHVPFTNNRAERDLRMSKVKQKLSGCFRTPQFAQTTAASPATCRPWPIAATFHSSLSKWHCPVSCTRKQVSSYYKI